MGTADGWVFVERFHLRQGGLVRQVSPYVGASLIAASLGYIELSKSNGALNKNFPQTSHRISKKCFGFEEIKLIEAFVKVPPLLNLAHQVNSSVKIYI